MNAQLLHVVSESFPASRKVYRSGRLHAGLKVPMREITCTPRPGSRRWRCTTPPAPIRIRM